MEDQKILLQKIVEGIQEKKRKENHNSRSFCHRFSFGRIFYHCEGGSTMQVSAIADNIREYTQQETGIKPFGYDGYQNSQWIVLDYGNIYVHVFLPEYREYYKLEQLWSDAKLTALPDVE